jgi:hypothetical protein
MKLHLMKRGPSGSGEFLNSPTSNNSLEHRDNDSITDNSNEISRSSEMSLNEI